MTYDTTLDIPVMLLAAGRGERMRPLTDSTPKPLLSVRGKSLLEWRMEALLQGGFHRVVLNTAWLGEQIETRFGPRFAAGPVSPRELALTYSREGLDFGEAWKRRGASAARFPCWAMRSGSWQAMYLRRISFLNRLPCSAF